MDLPHLLNIGTHIGAGTIAITLGLWVLATAKGTGLHRKRGRLFVWLTLVVCASAVIGNAVFRFLPLFAILTVLVSYQLLSGWHVVYTKEHGPNLADAFLCAAAALWGLGLVHRVLGNAVQESAPVVIYSTLLTLFALIVYDVLRWFFPRSWHTTLWRYEHIYKLTASLFAMTSAAAGNLFPQGQPWSQLLPSALGIATIGLLFVSQGRSAKRARSMRSVSRSAIPPINGAAD